MRRLRDNFLFLFEAYPLSVSTYILTMLFWAFIYFIQINIILNPVPEGLSDFRGEGIMFAVILVVMLSTIYFIVTILNLILHKEKSFYIRLAALIVFSNALLYGLGMC
jgi:hypothetical protein